MQSKFFAFMSRMKYINRWSLMRNTTTENIAEHSLNVSIIAHALALIDNKYFGGKNDACKIAMIGAYHETSEVITGDLPTPIKYFSPKMRDTFKSVENIAVDKILSTLPDDLIDDYIPFIKPTEEEYKFVKYADKISAYVKCLEELSGGNKEFSLAEQSIKQTIKDYNDKAVDYFMEVFVPAYAMTLDELSK